MICGMIRYPAGATGVCFVSYVLPVLSYWWDLRKAGSNGEAARLPAAHSHGANYYVNWSAQRGCEPRIRIYGPASSLQTLQSCRATRHSRVTFSHSCSASCNVAGPLFVLSLGLSSDPNPNL